MLTKHTRPVALVLIAVVVGLYAIEGYLTIRSQRQIVAQEEQRDLLTTGRTVAAAAAELWEINGSAGNQQLMKRLSNRAARVELRLIELPESNDAATRAAIAPAALARLRRGEPHSSVSAGGLGERVAKVLVPVLVHGEVAAAIEVVGAIDSTSALARGTVLRTAISTVLAVLAIVTAFALGWAFARRPSPEMIDKARGILSRASGASPSTAPQKDRIAELGLALDVLAGEIEEATARLELETNARLATLEQLQHADRLKTVGQLTSGILHEVGTPLTIVAGRCQMVADGEVEGDEARESARIAVEQTERITKMVRGILDFARRGRRAESANDLGNLARGTVKLMGPMALKRGVSLSWEGDAAPTPARFDTSLIQQVIANLALNAVQASPGGGRVTLSVERIAAAPPDAPDAPARQFWALHVEDEGEGMPPAELARIFDAFYTTKTEGEGTGLGLSISQQIVTDHGGWLAVRSEVGKGSRFTVHLPCEEETA